MAGLRLVAVPVALVALLLQSPVQASHTEGKILIHENTFSGDLPAGWEGSAKDLRYDDPLETRYVNCEWKRRTDRDGNFHQMVWPGMDDECPDGHHTHGAPREGDLSIYQTFPAHAGEVYKGWARASVWNATSLPEAFAQVKIIFFKTSGAVECYGRNRGSGEQVFATDQNTAPSGTALLTSDGGCRAPANTVSVHFHFRLHVEAPITVPDGTSTKTIGASGDAVLDAVKFGRCGSDCSNVSALPIASWSPVL